LSRAKEPVTITVDPDSELARALDESEAPVVLEVSGGRYRVSREAEDLWAGYDPAKVRAGLRRFAGSISPEEAERLKALIYRGREEGTRPLDRP
jgi:hypothetical protein